MPTPHHEVAVIGAGFAGLGTAIALREDGIEDFVVLEHADRLGGTWQANHYPGCACDVPTPYYSFSFAPKPDWSRLYAPHHEIQAYMEDCADRFGVRPHLRLGQMVTGARWGDEDQRWHVEVNGAPALTADAIVASPGALSRPSYPDIQGLWDFPGPVFHSADWQDDVDLTGKRVAVIGTGASAIQFVPRIVRRAAHVDVYQRTAPWVLPKPDREIGRLERALYTRLPITQKGARLVAWGMQEYMGLGNTVSQRLTRPLEAVGRRWIARWIDDPVLRAKVTPDFAIGCKRVLLSNDWYRALNRDDVEVVTDEIACVDATGVVTGDGRERAADVVILGTGFQVSDPVGNLPLTGRDGISFGALWEQGLSAHRGTTVAGFPNFFLIPGPNTGTGHTSQLFMIEQQIGHAMAALRRVRERGAASIEPRPEAQARFNAWVDRRSARTVWLRGGCHSWYLDERGRNVTLWPGGTIAFKRAMRNLDDREFVFEERRTPVAPPAPVPTAVPA